MRTYPPTNIWLVFAAAIIASTGFAQEDSLDRNYAEELPRIAPLAPADALASFEVLPGFQMELVAAEPLVRDPIAMAFDEDGRLFVVEMRGYSERRDANIGTIRMLTDDDGDGVFDRATDYVGGLAWPTAVACWDGGVFVAVAPDLLYCKDTDGDGRADVREVVYTGFGLSNVQGLVNSFNWGIDNRIHGATSSSGASLVPGDDPSAPPFVLRGRDFAFDPRTRSIEATTGGGQHGLSFDPWGNRYVCHNSVHCQFMIYEDHYLARNPYLEAPGGNLSIASDGPAADVFRISPVEPWRIVRTRLRLQGLVPGPVEGGGTAAGYFTSATGITVYKGDAWPESYRGNVIIGDVGSNLIHRKTVEWNDIVPVANRADAGTEFVRSTDIWFRPVQFCNGPDGALYVADMYREVIEHPDSLPPIIKQHLDLNSGNDRGRIYRIVPEDFEQPEVPKLGPLESKDLVPFLAHANAWHRETAARLLYERHDEAAVPLLRTIAADAPNSIGVGQVLSVLAGMNALEPADLLPHFASDDPMLRAHTVKLGEAFPDSPDVAKQVVGSILDEDVRVRYQGGFSVGAFGRRDRMAAIVVLAEQDANSPWMRLAMLSSAYDNAADVYVELMNGNSLRRTEAGRTVLIDMARQTGAAGSRDDVAALLACVDKVNDQDLSGPSVQALLGGLKLANRGADVQDVLRAGGSARAIVDAMLAEAHGIAADPDADAGTRVDSMRTLAFDEYGNVADTLASAFTAQTPRDVQTAALTTLRQFSDPDVASRLVDVWPGLSPELRAEALETLFSRPEWLRTLLDSIASGAIDPRALDSTHVQRLRAHPDSATRERAEVVLGKKQETPRDEVVKAYEGALTMQGDAARGQALFKENCAQCHRIGNDGNDVGPSLAGFAQGGADKVLVNVLDPNREVNPQYVSYTVETSDFETYAGVVASENATSVTLKRANGFTDTILRVNIESMQSDGLSLMPEGWEDTLDQQAMADLIAFLQTAE